MLPIILAVKGNITVHFAEMCTLLNVYNLENKHDIQKIPYG